MILATAFQNTAPKTQFTVADMGAPIEVLDKYCVYNRGVFIACDGMVSWDVATGTLFWTEDIHIYFTTAAGVSVYNFISGDSDGDSLASIADDEYVYVDLNETHNTELTMAKAAIPKNGASTYFAVNRLVLGWRNAASDAFIPRALNGVYFPTVYNDINFSVSGATLGPSAPSFEAFTTNTKAYAFAVGENQDLECNELAHWWKEGSIAGVHMHITTNDAVVVTEYAKFTLYIAYQLSTGIWTETSLTAETADLNGSADLQGIYLSLGNLDLAGITIGKQVTMRIERIAATTGTEYGADMFVNSVGMHALKDFPGSRSAAVK